MLGRSLVSILLRAIAGVGLVMLMLLPATLAGAATAQAAPSSTLFGSTVWDTANLSLKTTQFGHMPLVHYYYTGLPPMNAWSTGLGAAVQGSAEIVSFDGLPQDVISGADNAVLENFFDTAPTGHPIYYVYWHEPEIHVTDGQFTFAEYRAAWTDIVAMADAANNPDLYSTLCLLAYDVSPYSGQTWTNYLPAGGIISTLSWDAYPAGGVGTPNPATFMSGVVTASREAGLPFGWAEFGTTTIPGRPAWLAEVANFATSSGALFCGLYDAPPQGSLGGSGTYVITDQASLDAWKGAVSGTGTGDTVAPSVPTALTASAASGTKVALSWTASTDNIGVSGYVVERDANFVGLSTTTSYKDADLTSDTAYEYTVSAYDGAGNVSPESSPVSATTSGTEAPTIPTNLSGTAVGGTGATLSWTASSDPAGITGYRIYRNGWSVGTASTTSYQDSGLVNGTTYHYSVAAYDGAKNVSAESTTVLVTTVATEGPSVPTGVIATAPSGTEVDLSWTASTDSAAPVTSYTIYRNGDVAGTSSAPSFADTGLSDVRTYWYSIVARDSLGKVSAESNPVSVTTKDTEAPSVPQGLSATAPDSTEVDLAWTASTDNVGVTGYDIYRNTVLVATSATTSYPDMGLSASTSYKYSVSAYDAAGNVSAKDTPVSVTTPAGAGPSVPTNLAATAVSGSEVTLSWTASTDQAGITGYSIYRNGNLIGTSGTTSYSDTGLSDATAYQYSLSAYDAAGNVSAESSPLSVTTLDTEAPTVPTGLKAAASSSTVVKLSWTASNDNVGVTGYFVYRNGSYAGTSSTPSYSDTGLTAATAYQFSVAAYDSAANVSAESSAVSATTLEGSPPTMPTGLKATASSGTKVHLTWNASTDKVGVTGYDIYRNGKLDGTSATTSYTDSGLHDARTYWYSVAAFDAAGNVSFHTHAVVITTPGTSPSSRAGLEAPPSRGTGFHFRLTA
jgi:chitodextrinase